MMASWSSLVIFSSMFRNVVVEVLLLLAALYLYDRFFSIRYPPNLPRIRENGKTRFSLGTRWAYYTDCANLFREAYDTVSIQRVPLKCAYPDGIQYSKHGKSCLVPGLGFRNEVIIPSSSLRWITSQPDHRLSAYEAFRELDLVEFHSGPHELLTDPWQGMLVRRDMNRILERLVVVLNDELQYAFDARFGTDADEWTEINLYETMKRIVAQGSSRFTVGLPLCKNL